MMATPPVGRATSNGGVGRSGKSFFFGRGKIALLTPEN